MISEFNRFFSSKTLASTYKPTFLKCLLDLGDYKEDEGGQWVTSKGNEVTIDLNFIAARFLRYYWPLSFKFRLKQEPTYTPIAVYRLLKEYSEILGTKTQPTKKQLCLDKFAELRLRTIREGIKPQVLHRLLKDCKVYSVNKNSNSIVIKTDIISYMKQNKKILEAALNHMIAEFLEKFNSAPNISTKLEERINRSVLKKDEFAKIIKMQDSSCFYCHTRGNDFVQEHFIPWNYLFSTQNYNIVAACQTCNSSKNDRLPTTKYLDLLLSRNEKLEKKPYGYSREFMKNLYESCKIEYHGMERELWKNQI